jgi:hypothetical protein
MLALASRRVRPNARTLPRVSTIKPSSGLSQHSRRAAAPSIEPTPLDVTHRHVWLGRSRGNVLWALRIRSGRQAQPAIPPAPAFPRGNVSGQVLRRYLDDDHGAVFTGMIPGSRGQEPARHIHKRVGLAPRHHSPAGTALRPDPVSVAGRTDPSPPPARQLALRRLLSATGPENRSSRRLVHATAQPVLVCWRSRIPSAARNPKSSAQTGRR